MKKNFNIFSKFSRKDKSDTASTSTEIPIQAMSNTVDLPIETAPTASPQPITQPAPIPQPVTQPAPTPSPQPVTQPAPIPQPVTQPAPAPSPQLVTQPAPTPVPQPVTQPAPTPIPQPVTQPAPAPSPQLVTQPAPTPVPQPASAPILFHPNLLTLAQTLVSIPLTHELGSQLGPLAYKMTLTRQELTPFTDSIQKIIPSYQSALSQLKDTPDILKEFIIDCQTYSSQLFPSEIPTYEDFLDHQGIQIIKKQSTIVTTLYKLAPHLFDGSSDINLMSLLEHYTKILPTLNSHIATVQALSPIADALRKDILTFTDALNQMQTNKSMAVNWNSQKANFVKLRQELDTRRTKFIQDEEAINQSITSTYTELGLIHENFRQHNSFLTSLFEQLLGSVTPNAQIIAQRNQINQVIITLVGVQNNLLSYINTLS